MNEKRSSLSHSVETGQSLVEMAISMTFILILLAGVIYFGIALFYFVAMRDAAQEGALYGSMRPTDLAGINQRVANAAGNNGVIRRMFDQGELQVHITYTGPACEGNGITVTLIHNYRLDWLPLGSFLSPFLGQDFIRLRASVTDTILTPPCP